MNELTKREIIALEILNGLISKYALNKPDDQEIICKVAIEVADTFIKQLNE